MPNVFENKLREWREFRVQRLGQRVAALTECINGTSEEMYPELVADYYADRAAAAHKRSKIIAKLGQEA